MKINEVFNSLGIFLKGLLNDLNWSKAELNIKIQPKMGGMVGKYYFKEESSSLRTRFDDELEDKIVFFHKLKTSDGVNKWNKLKFIVYPDHKFETEFIWD